MVQKKHYRGRTLVKQPHLRKTLTKTASFEIRDFLTLVFTVKLTFFSKIKNEAIFYWIGEQSMKKNMGETGLQKSQIMG